MHIFVDESGTFAPVDQGTHSVSAVGALVVPDVKLPLLIRNYLNLRRALPKTLSGEVKGKLLNEREVGLVCDVLFETDCLFEAAAIDMGLETPEAVRAGRERRAADFTSALTDEHHPDVIEHAWNLRRTMVDMPLPLFVQSIVTFEVLAGVLYGAPLYYALRRPKELETFTWVIDGKEVNKVTTAETWWSEAMLPLLEVRSLREPMEVFDGGNYTYFFRKFGRNTPDRLKPHVSDPDDGMVNLHKIMKESFRFSSDPELGLELADVVTNATRRALQGNLGEEGWQHVPRLMLNRKQQYLTIISFGEPAAYPGLPYARIVARGFSGCGRPLLPRPRIERRSRTAKYRR